MTDKDAKTLENNTKFKSVELNEKFINVDMNQKVERPQTPEGEEMQISQYETNKINESHIQALKE